MERDAERPLTTAAEVLREARRRAGLTQIEVAERGCVAVSVISQVERGRRDPGLTTLQRLVAGAGYQVGLQLFRPDPRGEQLVGPIGRCVLDRRSELLEVLGELGLGRVWVTGAVARGEETWNSTLVLVVEGAERFGADPFRVLAKVVGALDGTFRVDVLPMGSGSPDDVLLGNATPATRATRATRDGMPRSADE